jgi:hypothetical protein
VRKALRASEQVRVCINDGEVRLCPREFARCGYREAN